MRTSRWVETDIEEDHLCESEIIDQIIMLHSMVGELMVVSGRRGDCSGMMGVTTYEIHPFKQLKEEQMYVGHVPSGYIGPLSLSGSMKMKGNPPEVRRWTCRFITLAVVLEILYRILPLIAAERSTRDIRLGIG